MALVLTRKVGESLIVEGGVAISVVQIKGRQVRLAIEAPGRKVYRLEMIDQNIVDNALKEVLDQTPLHK